jgi:potassium voltage-gated channel Eag-related subfamily H protein 8
VDINDSTKNFPASTHKENNSSREFTIYHQNIRGISSKIDEFQVSLYHYRPQVICLTEHHLRTEEITNVNLDQYKLGTFSCRKDYKGGGVSIYISQSLQCSVINLENYNKEKDLEICALKLNVQRNNFIIICIYRSPTGNFTHFLTQLEIILNDLYNTSSTFILCGDFNIDYIKDSCRKYSLESLLASYNFFGTVTFPTRVSKHSSTQIDNIYINTYKFDFSVYPVVNDLSDHDAQVIAFTGIFTPTLQQSFSMIRKVNKNTITNFACLLSYETWEDVFTETEVNKIYNKFLNTYLRVFYASFPLIKVKTFQSTKPWITKGIKISCLHKRQLYLIYRSSDNMDLKNYYKRYCQILSKVIITAKNLYYNKLISQANNKQKTTWNIINTLTNKRTSNENDPINTNGKPSTNTANAFNTYFVSAADKLLLKSFSATDITNKDDPLRYLRQNIQCCHPRVKLYNTTTYEINKIINSQRNKTSHGYDGISDKILKASAPFITSPLTYIFNKVLSTGVFPERLKYSEVQPLFKKGKKNEFANYRPISLLPSLSKIIEKIIYKRLISYFTEHNILANEQFGFKKNSTTDMATYALLNNIQLSLDKKWLV